MTTKEAIDHLRNALKEDDNYYHTWVANIAVAFQDEFHFHYKHEGIHEISNRAAERFMRALMTVGEDETHIYGDGVKDE